MRASSLPERVRVVEVGPRDGLQNEARTLPVPTKVGFIERLVAAGCPEIEIGSFVSRRWIPQLADTETVARALPKDAAPRFTALVPNETGMRRALSCGLRSIAVFTAASETFNQKNINTSIAGSIERFRPVLAIARREGIRVRGYVSTAFACPFEGPIDPAAAVRVVSELFDLEVSEVSVGDTIGVATPREIERFLLAARGKLDPGRLALHLHDTRGTALANVLAALQAGVSIFDSAAGGVGGCPYAPGASGNLATEDLLYMLHGLGIETGIDIEKVAEASWSIEPELSHPLPSRALKAMRAARVLSTRGFG